MLAPWIISHFPDHRIYVEPFGGGGSVLLRKPRSYAEIYNDLDDEVVNLFTVARDHGSDLLRDLELTPFSRKEFLLSYEHSNNNIERARRMIVRCFMGFGSNAHTTKTGFRSNSNKSGTTPAHDWKNYPMGFSQIIERLRGVVIENRDAKQVMSAHDSDNTLHYVDPPYVSSTRDKGNDYNFEMTDQDHIDLAKFLSTLQGGVIVSGYPSSLYNEIYSEWERIDKDSFADGAKKRIECLWLKNIKKSLFL
jgi:DNA adenine methylase